MAKTAPHTLAELLNAARSSSPGADVEHAQDVFFKALLGSTVYAHVPMESPPRASCASYSLYVPTTDKPCSRFSARERKQRQQQVTQLSSWRCLVETCSS